MPKLHPVARNRHGKQRWLRVKSYGFAARDAVVAVVAHELRRAVLTMPTGFVKTKAGYLPVVVQGLLPGRNLLVGADGRWLGSYIPAAYRAFPFQLAKTNDERLALCVDEDSGQITDDATQGEPFFAEDGKLSQPLAEVLDFLQQVYAAREETVRACAALDEHKLLRPWNIELEADEGAPRKVQGLFCIDEEALAALPAAALAAARDAGALKVAYLQLLSMQHLPMLARLAQTQAAGAVPVTPAGDLDLEFLNRGETISFGKPN
jgi:hypothetical protein